MEYIVRHAEYQLATLLRTFPAVLVLGPRQCGKSTLLRHVRPSTPHVDLDRPADRAQVTADIEGFLHQHRRGEFTYLMGSNAEPDYNHKNAVKQPFDTKDDPARIRYSPYATWEIHAPKDFKLKANSPVYNQNLDLSALTEIELRCDLQVRQRDEGAPTEAGAQDGDGEAAQGRGRAEPTEEGGGDQEEDEEECQARLRLKAEAHSAAW